MTSACIILVLATPVADASPEEVDHLELAALLIGDGHIDRAERVLAEMDPNEDGIDAGRLFTLRAVVALHNGDFQDCSRYVKKALTAGASDPQLHLYAAQAAYGRGAWQDALTALADGGAAVEGFAGTWLLRGECLRQLGQRELAWAALVAGHRRFPASHRIERQQVFMLIDAGLFQAAVERGHLYLSGGHATVVDWIALGEALGRAGRLDESARLLEEARIRFNNHADVLTQLAHTYIASEMPLAAAEMFEIGARRDPTLASDAAELYRRASNPERALMLNAQEPNQSDKLRQRMGLLVELDRFEEVAALEPRIERLGLLEDDEIAYALAYALFRTGRPDRAERYLKRVERTDLYESVTALRETMAHCQSEPWMCE